MMPCANPIGSTRYTYGELRERAAQPRTSDPRSREIVVAQPYNGVYQVIGGPRFRSIDDVVKYADRLGADIVWSV